MRQFLNIVSRGLRDLLPLLGSGEPIRTRAGLGRFIGERAAHISQTSLYGYLKTRMGTQYTTIFQDPVFQPALEAAREEAFFGCLSDLTIHAAAAVKAEGDLPARAVAKLAEELFRMAAAEALRETDADAEPAIAAFSERLVGLDWAAARDPRITFQSSQAVLVAAAPVIESYREADREIIENSVKFRWIDIRRQLQERLDPKAVAEDAVLAA